MVNETPKEESNDGVDGCVVEQEKFIASNKELINMGSDNNLAQQKVDINSIKQE